MSVKLKCIFDSGLKSRKNRDEKVSKCIFDLGLTQLYRSNAYICEGCEKVSKCIFDLGLTQQNW